MESAPEAETAEQTEERKRGEDERQKEEERKNRTVRQSSQGVTNYAKKHRPRSSEIVAEASRPSSRPLQLRVLLRALVHLGPYTFADDLAAKVSEDRDNDRRCAGEVLLTAIDGAADDQLTGFAARLAFAGHGGIPYKNESDLPHGSRSRSPHTHAEEEYREEHPRRSGHRRWSSSKRSEEERAAAQTERRRSVTEAGAGDSPATSLP